MTRRQESTIDVQPQPEIQVRLMVSDVAVGVLVGLWAFTISLAAVIYLLAELSVVHIDW